MNNQTHNISGVNQHIPKKKHYIKVLFIIDIENIGIEVIFLIRNSSNLKYMSSNRYLNLI